MSEKLDTLAANVATLATNVQSLLSLTAAHATNADLPAQVAADDAAADQLNAEVATLNDTVTAAIATYQATAPTPASAA